MLDLHALCIALLLIEVTPLLNVVQSSIEHNCGDKPAHHTRLAPEPQDACRANACHVTLCVLCPALQVRGPPQHRFCVLWCPP
jgi:hypothetical protein